MIVLLNADLVEKTYSQMLCGAVYPREDPTSAPQRLTATSGFMPHCGLAVSQLVKAGFTHSMRPGCLSVHTHAVSLSMRLTGTDIRRRVFSVG